MGTVSTASDKNLNTRQTQFTRLAVTVSTKITNDSSRSDHSVIVMRLKI
jgi:hypothetical protein